MNIFQSSLSVKTFELINEYLPRTKVNLLRSFALDDNQTFYILSNFAHLINNFILDSGVWSKNQNPSKYNHTVGNYQDFLLSHSDKITTYFNYDEDFKLKKKDIFGDKNWENQKILEDAGLHPIPVLHTLKQSEINYIVENKNKYPFVAIGSNAISLTTFRSTVSALHKADIKVHAFKIGSSRSLIGLEAWSSDCSSHARWTSAGRCVILDCHCKKHRDTPISFRSFRKSGLSNKDFYEIHPLKNIFLNFIEKYVGITLSALQKDSNYRTFANSIYFHWLERYVSSKNHHLGIKFDDDPRFDNPELEYIFSNIHPLTASDERLNELLGLI